MIDVVSVLASLISIPSFSREEDRTARRIGEVLAEHHIPSVMIGNNVVAWKRCGDPDAAVVVLNSHHDTVRPTGVWTSDPYTPDISDGKLYGLGSNDAGGPLVTMLACFIELHKRQDLRVDICFAATCEEEVSGTGGMERLVHESIFGEKPPLLTLVGEPTQMNLAVAEKGLVVLDCLARGRAGHAARNEGVNAITLALKDIAWLNSYQFPDVSEALGQVRITTTQINAGSQHNVVPAECAFVVDVRTTDCYTNEEVVSYIQDHMSSEVTPRSYRLRPSALPDSHPFYTIARDAGLTLYGSPTMSDQAMLPSSWASAKIGPGDSARSHTSDEFIYVDELVRAPQQLLNLLIPYLTAL